jgi:branched-subunit amino acid ABC-type transport system permease component
MMLGVTWINSQIIFDGIVQGLAIAMIAVGVVLIYRTTRIINFAVANMGVVGAAVLSLLVVQYHVAFWAALAIALLIGVALGALVEIGIIRRLHKAPRVVLLVGTIGLAQVLQVIGDEVPLPSNESAHYPSGITGSWTLGGITIRGADLDILILVPIAIIALAWFLERTLLGKTVKACATNPQLARLSSISPKLVSTMVWALGAALATLSLVLISGESSLAGSLGSIGPETLAFGLAAALLAQMSSFPRALVAGVAIGIGQSLISFNFIADTGLTELMVFVTVLVAVIFYGRERSGEQEVFAFTPRSRPIPERLRSLWWARNIDKSGLIILGIVAVILPIIVTTPSKQQLYTSVLAFAICACSLTVITGWQGQLSLGQMGIAGIATLLAARLVHAGVPFWAAIAVMTLGAALLAIGLGISSLRVRGLYLAVVTFTFALAAQQYFYYLPALSGDSSDGANVPFPVGKLWFISFPGQRAYFYAVLVILVLVLVVLSRFRDSNVGRSMKAVRDNENAASAYTLVPARIKVPSPSVAPWRGWADAS